MAAEIINTRQILTAAKKLDGKIYLVVGVFLLIILIAGGLWLVHARNYNAKHPYKYAYHKLDSYKLPGPATGSGGTVSKPVEFVEKDSLSPTKDYMMLTHDITNRDKKSITLAYEVITATHLSLAFNLQDMANLDKALIDTKNPTHTAATAPITNFVKNNAWEMSFTATDPKANEINLPARLQGEAVLAAGKSTYYYFMVTAIDYNWQSNLKIWQQVVDSLKIDQQ